MSNYTIFIVRAELQLLFIHRPLPRLRFRIPTCPNFTQHFGSGAHTVYNIKTVTFTNGESGHQLKLVNEDLSEYFALN